MCRTLHSPRKLGDPYADEAIRRLDDAGAVDPEQRSAELRTEADSQSIPVVEERLRVGKREVDRGTVRVRSYIVEEPVHEEVNLREEQVETERRPVNPPLTFSSTDVGNPLHAASLEDRILHRRTP